MRLVADVWVKEALEIVEGEIEVLQSWVEEIEGGEGGLIDLLPGLVSGVSIL